LIFFGVLDLEFQMNLSIPDKEYFRIGEVSKILGVDTYVVRYWESEFKSIKPIRTKSDQRLYRRKDLEDLLIIKNLLYTDKFTISGAKKQLLKMKEVMAQPDKDREKKRLVEIKKGLLQIKKILS
jgi:Predicted transcriptional regulators